MWPYFDVDLQDVPAGYVGELPFLVHTYLRVWYQQLYKQKKT